MIKVLIADDHAIVRRGLKQILEETPDIVVRGEAANADEVFARLRLGAWDVLVLDINMPGRSGVDVLKEIKRQRAKLPVLILSMHAEEQYAARVLKAGASGYLPKESAPDELVKAIRKVHGGGRYVSPAQAEKLLYLLNQDNGERPHETLSDREYEVLRRIASGRTISQIGVDMKLSVKTVSTYRTRLLEKMRMKTNAELTHYGIKQRLVE